MWCGHCGLRMMRRLTGGWMHAASNYADCKRVAGYWTNALPTPTDQWAQIPRLFADTLLGRAAFYPGPNWNLTEKPSWPTMY